MKITFNNLKNYFKPNNKYKKNIGIFIGGKTYYSASSYIRLLSPLNELVDEYNIQIIDDNNRQHFYQDLDEKKCYLNILIIQRDIFDRLEININLLKSLYKKLKRNNIKIIFDIDDDLLNIDKKHPSYEKFFGLGDSIKFIISNSDVITVSTNYLKNQLKKYNKNIEVIPNTLMNLWNFNYNEKINNLNSKKAIKIGYFGTRTHSEDLQIIEKSIKNVKKYFNKKDITLEVIGSCTENYNWIKRIEIPNNYTTSPDIKEFIKNKIRFVFNKLNLMPHLLPYPIFINWMVNEIDWDLAVAPLTDNYINRSKSNLKYLEYTALNIPCIYSNIGPYKEISEKNTGIVVNNTTEEWENALIKLIEDNELYETILKNAHEDVSKNYMVENASLIWKRLLNDLL